nr:EamA family transporter [Nesterenkonia sp. HG001]
MPGWGWWAACWPTGSLRRLPVTATALLGLLSPLVAALLGAVLLGEAFTWWQLSGFGLALAALVAGQVDPTQLGQGAHSARVATVEEVSLSR